MSTEPKIILALKEKYSFLWIIKNIKVLNIAKVDYVLYMQLFNRLHPGFIASLTEQ